MSLDVGHLFEQHGRAIFGYLYRRTGDAELSEDLTQQVFLQAFAAAGRYQDRGRPAKAWLYRIAINLLVEHHRRQRRRPCVTLDAAVTRGVVDAGAEHHLDSLDLDAALARLRPQQRAVLVERYLVGRSHRETAALVGSTEHGAKKLQDRALARLRERMEGAA